MSNPKGYLGRKAAKATVRHGVHGTVSKAKRDPVRNSTLLGVGLALGAAIGWALARVTTSPDELPAAEAPA